MKPGKFITFIIPIMMFSNGFCQAQSSGSSDKQIVELLKAFYVNYITENAKMPVNLKSVEAIKKKYCTARFISKIEKKELDYDVILNAQDCDLEWLKTLSVTKDSKRLNTYVVSYVDNYSKKMNSISLVVVSEKGEFKVNSIFYRRYKGA